jgi:hypothetical protein
VISVPWPGNGPVFLYGENAVAAFNQYVDALELQDYSSSGTPARLGPARDLPGGQTSFAFAFSGSPS